MFLNDKITKEDLYFFDSSPQMTIPLIHEKL